MKCSNLALFCQAHNLFDIQIAVHTRKAIRPVSLGHMRSGLVDWRKKGRINAPHLHNGPPNTKGRNTAIGHTDNYVLETHTHKVILSLVA